jgi:hypothetical protein
LDDGEFSNNGSAKFRTSDGKEFTWTYRRSVVIKKILMAILILLSGSSAFGQLTGNFRFPYGDSPLCDSVIFVHEYQGTKDSAIYTNCYGLDTTIAASAWASGVHNVTIRFKYNGYSYWATSNEIIDNTAKSSGGVGSGMYAIRLYAVDTSGTDTALSNVPVVVRTLAGDLSANGSSNNSGYFDCNLDAGSYTALANRPAYYFWPKSLTIAGAKTDTIFGFNSPFPTVTTPQTCAVRVIILNPDGTAAQNVTVTANMARSAVIDSAGRGYTMWSRSKTTNSLGIADFNCVWSSYLIPATDYTFSVGVGGKSLSVTASVPRQTSGTLDFKTKTIQ